MDMNAHFALGLFIRVAITVYGYIQDAFFEVKYTDVDYLVFTDAARHMAEGLSPFKRPTYRYTPALAFLLLPNVLVHEAFGKVLFCLFDVLTSVLILRIQRNFGFSEQVCRTCVFLWLYNPLPIVISTRGSAESVMTFFTVLSVLLCQANRPLLLGLVYGLSVHVKIYPCIFVTSFYLLLPPGKEGTDHDWRHLLRPSPSKLTFLASSAAGFLLPTATSLLLYGEDYLQEALLYHMTRKDIRHNFSPYFYLSYLLEYCGTSLSAIPFLLQSMLLVLTSCRVRPLPACLLVQAFLFVTFNKVCTSQYFLWYLCLFPLCYPLVGRGFRSSAVFLAWLGGQGLWLLPAYCLEFRGSNAFLSIFGAGLVFFLLNVYVACYFVRHLMQPQTVGKKET